MSRALAHAELCAVLSACVVAAALAHASFPSPLARFTVVPLVLALLAWIAMTDARNWIIPDGAVIALGILGAALRLAEVSTGTTAADAVFIGLDGLAWGGAFLVVREAYFRCRGLDGLGLGDVKLATACGLLQGAVGFAWTLLLASLAGLVAAALVRRSGAMLERIPFGAFLAPACGIVWLVQLTG